MLTNSTYYSLVLSSIRAKIKGEKRRDKKPYLFLHLLQRCRPYTSVLKLNGRPETLIDVG